MASRVDLALGILNGTIGQFLAKTGNGLAIELGLYLDGAPLAIEREVLGRAYPSASRRVVVLVHGLMATEASFSFADGRDYGRLLERDHGMTPLYVRYNSGVAIADNGAALARLLEQLAGCWPVALEELVLVGHSMGGLVLRAACHAAQAERHDWLALVQRAFYVGTPHLGSPFERLGRTVSKILRAIPDPYTQLIAQIAELRSDGIKDLGDGDAKNPVPMLPQISHYLVAGTALRDPRLALLFGDILVPVHSATYRHVGDTRALALPPEHVCIIPETGHNALAHHPLVYEAIHRWLSEPRA